MGSEQEREQERQHQETWALLGASRGLGRAFFLNALGSLDRTHFHLVSRKESLLKELAQASTKPHETTYEVRDFSSRDGRAEYWSQLLESQRPTRIFYFAGGGPYGNFETKSLKDHYWAFETSFLAPMELIFKGLTQKGVRQIVMIGSAVAEDLPDPRAASYAAGKHALKGLLSSVWAEERVEPLDLRLYSPSYMDTDLLPPGAAARHSDEITLCSVDDQARHLLQWCLDPGAQRHYKQALK